MSIVPGATRIDAHTHIFAPGQRESRSNIAERDAAFADIYSDPAAKMATAPELADAMARASLDGAVAAGFAFANPHDLDEQNAYLAEAAEASAGSIAWLGALNLAEDGWRARAEGVLKAGARGFGELRPANQLWDPLGPRARELYEMARANDAVLLWHASEPVGHRYPGKTGGIAPAQLIEVALAFPGLKMVAAHLGAGASFYFQMPELQAAIDSVYFDTAAVSLLYHKQAVARTVEIVGADRVLFGSDFPLQSPARQLQVIGEALPDSAVGVAVCGGNADALYFSSRLAVGTGVSRSGE